MEGLNSFETCCRLCAEEQEATILIFSAEAEAMLLQNKLNKYLLIEVDEDDKLPKNICIRCCSKLQMVCDFIDTARKAQDILSQKMTAIEENEQHLSKIKTENETCSDNETKFNTMEVNVDPMIVLQNSEGVMSPNNDEACNTNETEDVRYLHSIDGEDVTIKLIKKADTDPTEDSDNKGDMIKPFPCLICNRSFCTELALKNHSWIHNNEERAPLQFVCTSCGVQCDSKAGLLSHLKKHRVTGLCQLCGRITEKNLAIHMANHMPSGKSYTCKICGRSYNTLSNLKNHSITHSNERPYQCHVCKKGFKRNQDLKFHLNQHTGAKPYKCLFCDKSFASSGNCYSHRTRMHPGWKTEAKFRRRVVDIQPHVIRTAVPKSTSNSNIKSVMRYQCTLCSHTFLRRDNYMYHMYQHTGKKPFQCTFCSEEFVTRKGLYLHHEKKHPGKDRPLGLVSKNVLLK